MDHLTFIVHNITPEVRATLVKRISTQQKKLQLFRAIEQDGNVTNQWLNSVLGYPSDNFTNLYTLKNRLFDDIVDVVTELAKNNVVLTKEKVQSLRMLLHSRDKLSLLRELKRHEKKALEFELFSELKEIYFCFFLTFRNNPKKSRKYAALMDEYDEKQGNMYLLEKLFYAELQETHDLFYNMNDGVYQKALQSLDLVNRLHTELQTKSSKFLYLSAKLNLQLTHTRNIADATLAKAELDELAALYNDPTVADKYPNWQVSIQCLYSRYYFLTGRHPEFFAVQKSLRKGFSKGRGYQIFDYNYFYFVYVSLISNTLSGDPESSLDMLVNALPEDDLDIADSKMRVYMLHLHALKLLLQKRYRECSDQLMEARKYFADLNTLAGWVVIDNLLLNIITRLVLAEADLIEPEIYLLKRRIRKLGLGQQYLHHLRNFTQEVRLYKRQRNHARIAKFFCGLRDHLGVLRAVPVDERMFSWKNTEKPLETTVP